MATKTVRKKGNTALVETTADNGDIERVIVPTKDADKPERGIPQGIEWAEVVTIEITPGRIQQELRKRNIWEYEDILTNPSAMMGALQAALRGEVTQLLNAAKAARNQENS